MGGWGCLPRGGVYQGGVCLGVSARGGVVPGRGLPKGRCLPMGGLPGGVYIIPVL